MRKTKSKPDSLEMVFTVDGESELSPSNKTPACVVKAVSVLDSLPDGTLLKYRTLLSRMGFSITSGHFSKFVTMPELSPYRFKRGLNVYYGNKTTITTAKEKFKQ